ncbi:Septin-2 [Chionoecetes opilio]|uniref:Septin-2 n=1 Tax=Chionoecetes opilio TaxID=41210 RepID=A0A8J4XKV4_CHIOP|nr:Septin-2 [Chionoecetes opilio]
MSTLTSTSRFCELPASSWAELRDRPPAAHLLTHVFSSIGRRHVLLPVHQSPAQPPVPQQPRQPGKMCQGQEEPGKPMGLLRAPKSRSGDEYTCLFRLALPPIMVTPIHPHQGTSSAVIQPLHHLHNDPRVKIQTDITTVLMTEGGESGLGKSTLINTLFLTDLYPDRLVSSAQENINKTVKIDVSTVEIEERGVKVRLTVVDTPGYGDAIDNTDCFQSIIQYINDQFERYLQDESGLNRRHIVDNRVHCCFYFINPAGHGLKPLDIQFMKQLHNKVNIVPGAGQGGHPHQAGGGQAQTQGDHNTIIQVLDEIEENGIHIYPLPDCDTDEEEDYKEQVRGGQSVKGPTRWPSGGGGQSVKGPTRWPSGGGGQSVKGPTRWPRGGGGQSVKGPTVA